MEVKNCRKCKRLFNYITGPQICPVCKEELEKKFQEAKEYIRNNKDVTITSIAEELDIPETQIKEWIREERLVFTNASVAGVVCEKCGTPISTGRFCDRCKASTVNDLNGLFKKDTPPPVIKKEKDSPKMRFLDNR